MIEIKAPLREFTTKESVFLAGSIEMGAAEQWQSRVATALADKDIAVYNPRRDDWDSSWVQHIDNPQFNAQVTWEIEFIEYVNTVFFYFSPGTQSPITLMELGYCLGLPCTELIIVCPDEFWRSGNINILCKRCGVKVHKTLEDGIAALSALGEIE